MRNTGTESQIANSLLRLDSLARGEGFKGYDPYDLLASRLPLRMLDTKACYYLTQLNKRDPYRILRTLLAIPKQSVPKALALFIQSYATWKNIGLEPRDRELNLLQQALDDLRSPGHGDKYCWGLNYPYATSLKYVPRLQPSLVVTAYVHRAFEALYQLNSDEELVSKMESGIRFLLEDLPRTEEDGLICFSYYPSQRDVVYNANAKAAEMLARMSVLTGKREYADLAYRSMDFTLKYQKPDGRWNYRRHEDGSERAQIDFHQLDIVESLCRFIELLNPTSSKYEQAMHAALDFFLKEQLSTNGTVHYRWPRYWPVDTHNQASAIVTFALLSDKRPELLEHATDIADFTIRNMQRTDGGFIYQKGRYLNNRTPYIRWSNAWMHLALTTLLERLRN